MTKRYDNNLKFMIANLICNEKRSTIKTAREYGIPLKTVENWVTAFNKDRHCFDQDYRTSTKQIMLLKRKVAELEKSINTLSEAITTFNND